MKVITIHFLTYIWFEFNQHSCLFPNKEYHFDALRHKKILQDLLQKCIYHTNMEINYCRMADFSVSFIIPYFPECFQTGINNTGKNNTSHVRTK